MDVQGHFDGSTGRYRMCSNMIGWLAPEPGISPWEDAQGDEKWLAWKLTRDRKAMEVLLKETREEYRGD